MYQQFDQGFIAFLFVITIESSGSVKYRTFVVYCISKIASFTVCLSDHRKLTTKKRTKPVFLNVLFGDIIPYMFMKVYSHCNVVCVLTAHSIGKHRPKVFAIIILGLGCFKCGHTKTQFRIYTTGIYTESQEYYKELK